MPSGLPNTAQTALDLGCVCRLEIDEIYQMYPNIAKTSDDMVFEMLRKI